MAQTNWAIEKKLKIGGEGAWDYLTVDPKSHRLFVPTSTHTMVIDADSGKTLGDIPPAEDRSWCRDCYRGGARPPLPK